MIAVIAKLHVAEGKEAAFEEVMSDLIAQVRANEAGNHLYTLCKDDTGGYLMLELYETQEDLDAHGQTEHFRTISKRFAGLMSGAPEIQRLQVVA